MYLIDFPRFFPIATYDLAIRRMVEKLRHQDGVISIFQIGSINNPGISDIDMLVVFEEGVECQYNPRQDLSKIGQYLFSHSLYGTSEAHFQEVQRYTFFHNYNLLWGHQLPVVRSNFSFAEIQTLKIQTALEYLLQMYISLTVKITYGIFRIVGLFRQVNALRYDLEFLDISSGKLFDLIETLISWRDHWFENKPTTRILRIWIVDFYRQLSEFLRDILQTTKFYLPRQTNLRIARNITLVPSERLGYVHKGIILPSFLGGLGRKYFNLQHRFNNFKFLVPITAKDIPNIIGKRAIFIGNMKTQNKDKLPFFMPLASNLNIR